MTRLATVLLIYLAGLASGLPAGVVAHEASAGAMSKTALNEGEKVSMANVAKAELKACPQTPTILPFGNGLDCTQIPQSIQDMIKQVMKVADATVCYPPPYHACSIGNAVSLCYAEKSANCQFGRFYQA